MQILNRTSLIASGNFWHKTISDHIGGFDERFEYSPDAEYWNRIAYNYPVVKVKLNFAAYNCHTSNYMWTTWGKDDFLEQTSLLARTYLKYTCEKEEELTEEKITDGINSSVWQTIITILSSLYADKNRKGLFNKYINIGFNNASSFNQRLQISKYIIRSFFKRLF